MNQKSSNATKTKKRAKKPVRLARRWGKEVLPMARKLAVLTLAIVLLGLMFSALQAVGIYWVRFVLSALLAGGMLLILYTEGVSCGVANVSASRQYVQMEAEGRKLTDKEDAACYHPLKALSACAVMYAIPLLLAIYLAFNAEEYTYTLQSIPSWLTQTYAGRSDVLAPLAAYSQTVALTATDVIRMIVRLFELFFVNFFSDPQQMTGMIDRLSPLLVALLPLSYVAGYLCGPHSSEKIAKQNRRAKKVAARKAERTKVADELLGNPKQVHYGHQVKDEKHKKKELI